MIITTVVVILISTAWTLFVGTTVGIYVYVFTKNPLSKEDAAELAQLRKEMGLRQKKILQDAELLVTNAAANEHDIATTTTEVHENICASTRLFDREIESAKNSTLQLEEIVALLQKITQSKSSNIEGLILEIKNRLDVLSTENAELEATCESLKKTAGLLEETVAGYASTQKHLENVIQTAEENISDLTRTLLAAKREKRPDSQDIKINEMALFCAETENKKLEAILTKFKLQQAPLVAKLKSAADVHEAQAIKMREVLAENHKLSQKVRELGLKLEEKDAQVAERPSANTHALTLFGHK